ncbi:MAG: hypothetical protein E7081_07075 [Bacteroidales bacterium]|nr:hypothetical protein [Bacteroidales bacterium]
MKTTILSLLLMISTTAMAQTVIVNVSALTGKGSYEQVGVVLEKDANTDEFYNLAVELKKHSDYVMITENQSNRSQGKSDADKMNEAFAKMEELKKRGLVTDADIQRLKTEMNAQLEKDAENQAKLAQMASNPSSDPVALKENIRRYCVDNRFFYSASKEVNGMVRVETRTADGKRRMGYIDATIGRVVIEPDRYSIFNNGTTKGFTNDGYIIGHSVDGAVILDKTGRIVLEGYKNLYFYDDCRILKAQNAQKKWGIIDYQGNVLEPFIHGSSKSESLQKAANRIFKENGGVKVQIW